MNTINTIDLMTDKQALAIALVYNGIENDEYRCLSNNYENGFFHIVVLTAYLRYEVYVDVSDGNVAGIDTEPLQYEEKLYLTGCGEDRDTPSAA